MRRVNIGCGTTPTTGWENYDNSLTVRIAQSSVLTRAVALLRLLSTEQMRFVRTIQATRIRWADATRSIPESDCSVDVAYSSHMLEHLERPEARAFLKEVMRILKPGGHVRISVPDIRILVDRYLADGDADAFVSDTLLATSSPGSLRERIRNWLVGDRHHKWMYDESSLTKLLEAAGFVNARTLPPGRTQIPDCGELDLSERADQSIFVEARKPTGD